MLSLAIIFLTHKLFSNQIKIFWKRVKVLDAQNFHICQSKANKKSSGLSRCENETSKKPTTQNLTVKYEHMEFWLAKKTGFFQIW